MQLWFGDWTQLLERPPGAQNEEGGESRAQKDPLPPRSESRDTEGLITQDQPPSVITTLSNGLAREVCPFPGINTIYLRLYCFTNSVLDSKLHNIQKKVKTSYCQENKADNVTRLRWLVLELSKNLK